MKLFFAGAEAEKNRNFMRDIGIKKILVSYFYVKERKVNLQSLFDNFEYVVIDSGAFTMLQTFQDVNLSVIKHEEYLNGYLELLHNNIGKFFWAANYDIDLIVGSKKVYEWNKKFEVLEKLGQTICYIAHDYSVPYKNLYNYANSYKYIGIAGDEKLSKNSTKYLEQVYTLARRNKIKVHGFAMTNLVSQDKFPSFSVDSTTYLGSARYGSTYVWNGAFFETWDYHHKHQRKQLGTWCQKWNLDLQKLLDDDIDELTKFSMNAWLYNEAHFNRKTIGKQWWLDSEERKEIINFRLY